MLRLRDFEERDYDALARLRGRPGEAAGERERDQRSDAFFRLRRWTAEDGTQILGFAQYEQNRRTPPGCYMIEITVDRTHVGLEIEAALFDKIVGVLSTPGLRELRTLVPAQLGGQLQFFADRGFRVTNTSLRMRLDLTDFRFEDWKPAMVAVRNLGYRFQRLTEVLSGEAAASRLWPVYREASADIPMGSPPQTETLEQFRRRVLERPSLRRDLSCAALYDGEYIGVAELQTSGLPERLGVHYTGVVRAHRRRGVATALKLETMLLARDGGCRYVITWNHTNNAPVLRVNEKLGFETIERIHLLEAQIAIAGS